MSKPGHQRFLEESVRRAALRAQRKAPDKTFQLRDVHRIRVQTVEPSKRIVALLLGLAGAGGGFLALSASKTGLGIFLFIASFFLTLTGVFGWKKTIEGLADVIDVGELLSGIFECIDFF